MPLRILIHDHHYPDAGVRDAVVFETVSVSAAEESSIWFDSNLAEILLWETGGYVAVLLGHPNR